MKSNQSPQPNGKNSPARPRVGNPGEPLVTPVPPKPSFSERFRSSFQEFSNFMVENVGLEPHTEKQNGLLDSDSFDKASFPSPQQPVAVSAPKKPAPQPGTPKKLTTPPPSTTKLPLSANGKGRVSPPKPLSPHMMNGETKHLNGDTISEQETRKKALSLIEQILEPITHSFTPINKLIIAVMENIKINLNGNISRSINSQLLETVLSNLNKNDNTSIENTKRALDILKVQFPQRYRKEDLLSELKGFDLNSKNMRILVPFKKKIEDSLQNQPLQKEFSSTKYREEFPPNSPHTFLIYLFQLFFPQDYEEANKAQIRDDIIREQQAKIRQLENEKNASKAAEEKAKQDSEAALKAAKEHSFLTSVFAGEESKPIETPIWIMDTPQPVIQNQPAEIKEPIKISAEPEAHAQPTQANPTQRTIEPVNNETPPPQTLDAKQPPQAQPVVEKAPAQLPSMTQIKEVKISIAHLTSKIITDYTHVFASKVSELKNRDIQNTWKEINKLKVETDSGLSSKIENLKTDNGNKELLQTILQTKLLQNMLSQLSDPNVEIILTALPEAKENLTEYAKWITSTKEVIKKELEKELADDDNDAKHIENQKKEEAAKAEAMREVEKQPTDVADPNYVHPKTPHSHAKARSRSQSIGDENSPPKPFVSIATSEEKKDASTLTIKTDGSPKSNKSDNSNEGDDRVHREGGASDAEDEDRVLHSPRISPISPNSRDSIIANRGRAATPSPESKLPAAQPTQPKKSFTDRRPWTARLAIGGAVLLGCLAIGALFIPIPGINFAASALLAKLALSSASMAGGIAAGMGAITGITVGAGVVGGALGSGIGYAIDRNCPQKERRPALRPGRRETLRKRQKERANSSEIFDRVGNPSAPVSIGSSGPQVDPVVSQNNPPRTYTPTPSTPPISDRQLRREARRSRDNSDEENRSTTPSP